MTDVAQQVTRLVASVTGRSPKDDAIRISIEIPANGTEVEIDWPLADLPSGSQWMGAPLWLVWENGQGHFEAREIDQQPSDLPADILGWLGIDTAPPAAAEAA